VIGQTVATQLFGGGRGSRRRPDPYPGYHRDGVLRGRGQAGCGWDQDDVLLMPFTTAVRRVLGTKSSARWT
jgi:hypothetical protein